MTLRALRVLRWWDGDLTSAATRVARSVLIRPLAALRTPDWPGRLLMARYLIIAASSGIGTATCELLRAGP